MCEISVIIPVYNKKDTIERTIRSVLDQTFRDLELLLIDDGSTDGSAKLCDELAGTDARIRIIHTENRGVSAARNEGLKAALGKYVSFIDADDHIESTFLEKLHDPMVSENVNMAVCGYREIRNGKIKSHLYECLDTGDDIYEYLREDMLCILWNKLFVRDKIEHPFDESISTCEDSIFVIRYFLDNDPSVTFVNECLYGYLVRKDGLSSTYHEGAFSGINKLLKMNRKLAARIASEDLKRLGMHHVFRVYFYGIYTYIFVSLSIECMSGDNLSVIDEVINDRTYRKIIKLMFRYQFRDRRAERTSAMESLIILFSLLRMKKVIWFLSKVKNVCTR